MSNADAMHVRALYRYPVKSMRGEQVSTLELDTRGPVGDRRYMVVDVQGRFLTQRQAPLLARATPRLVAGGLELQADGMKPLQLAEPNQDAPALSVTVWRDTVWAADTGDAAADWLERLLGRPARLVHQGVASRRAVNPQFAPYPDAQNTFSDGYPLLLTTEASLAALEQTLPDPIGMARFRPNVVVAETEAWAEDHWHALQLESGLGLWAVKPCVRCVIVDTDQLNGDRTPGALESLRRHHSATDQGPVFGINAVHARPGTIRAGETIQVRSTLPRPEWSFASKGVT